MNPKIRCLNKNNIFSLVTVVIATEVTGRKHIGKIFRQVFGHVLLKFEKIWQLLLE
ncbi:MAG: hypothetical protein PARBA_01212 [Parabacteroides sp.]